MDAYFTSDRLVGALSTHTTQHTHWSNFDALTAWGSGLSILVNLWVKSNDIIFEILLFHTLVT